MILIALGSNLPSHYGSPERTLAAALKKLDEVGIRVVQASRVYTSAPVPASDQPWFRNAVARVQTDLPPEALMALLHLVEADFGRIRTGTRDEARILDLDIIDYKGRIYEEGELVLPHPRLSERAFVLYPLREVASHWIHPVSKLGIEAMISALPEGMIAEPLHADAA